MIVSKMKKISVEARCVIYLVMAEQVLSMLDQNDERYKETRQALEMCWQWIRHEPIDDFDLYNLIDNEEGRGITIFWMCEENEKYSCMWRTIVSAVTYVCWQAFLNQGDEMTQILESIEEEDITLVIETANKTEMLNYEKIDLVLNYLLKNHPNSNYEDEVPMYTYEYEVPIYKEDIMKVLRQ